ncbi:MAG: Asp-tRNA(Asn)/Glu-tRNA(Gln) amidotransferase subunit GatC [Treponema sp.]|nr:Asp-tRNA(Asn)/Glu-tRNA(Gln) amidotransferase subunit GatC [Treponema sp.]
MHIDNNLLSYLEDLSCLTLSDKEKSRLADDLQKIVNGIAPLSDLHTDGVAECSHVFCNSNVFRDDTVHPSFDRELILKNAPVRNKEFFIAPKTME